MREAEEIEEAKRRNLDGSSVVLAIAELNSVTVPFDTRLAAGFCSDYPKTATLSTPAPPDAGPVLVLCSSATEFFLLDGIPKMDNVGTVAVVARRAIGAHVLHPGRWPDWRHPATATLSLPYRCRPNISPQHVI